MRVTVPKENLARTVIYLPFSLRENLDREAARRMLTLSAYIRTRLAMDDTAKKERAA